MNACGGRLLVLVITCCTLAQQVKGKTFTVPSLVEEKQFI